MLFAQVTKTEIRQVVDTLNTKPRKIFGYKTPNEVLAEKLDKNLSVEFINWIPPVFFWSSYAEAVLNPLNFYLFKKIVYYSGLKYKSTKTCII